MVYFAEKDTFLVYRNNVAFLLIPNSVYNLLKIDFFLDFSVTTFTGLAGENYTHFFPSPGFDEG